MEIRISNIGILKDINIKLDKLTVIASKNDNGKSTIGKTLYASIKAINGYKDDFNTYKYQEFSKIIATISERLENNFEINHFTKTQIFKENNIEKNKLLHEDIENNNIIIEFNESNFRELNHILFTELVINKNTFNITENDIFKKIIKFINTYSDLISDSDLNIIKKELEEISIIQSKTLESMASTFISIRFRNMFKNNLINHNVDNSAEVSIFENDNEIFNIDLLKDGTSNLNFIRNSQSKDITYIESPYILNENNSFSSHYLLRNNRSNSIVTDLQKKISDLSDRYPSILEEIQNEKYLTIIGEIDATIGGSFKYQEQPQSKLVFEKNGHAISLNNVATGIKSFAIIELLLKNNNLSENSILIIDEPEVHLHPKWQVIYAQILVTIIKKANIKVLINSHSTYFIEALSLFSKSLKIEDSTNFYLLESEENGSVSKYCPTLEPIFDQLNESFDLLDQERGKLFNQGDSYDN